LTFKRDLDMVNMNQTSILYPIQIKSHLVEKLLSVYTDAETDIHVGPIALPGPLK